MARILPAERALAEALALLEAGEVVAVPTETVYGLAGDAGNGRAVARIFAAKGRPRFNPLIAHVADPAMADRTARFDPLAARLAAAFWPGPLTLVLPLRPGAPIHPLVSAGLDSVALRMPRGFAGSLIAALGRPLAAPSANSSGRLTATTAAAVAADLGERIPLIVDGGPALLGLESTIVKVADGVLHLLRPGAIAAEDLERIGGRRVRRAAAGEAVEAPGMLSSHYAPRAGLRLGVRALAPGEALLGFGPSRAAAAAGAVAFRNLSAAADLGEAAANLFSDLAALDGSGAATIAVEPIPPDGLGEAINDRLRRAAAPRNGPAGP